MAAAVSPIQCVRRLRPEGPSVIPIFIAVCGYYSMESNRIPKDRLRIIVMSIMARCDCAGGEDVASDGRAARRWTDGCAALDDCWSRDREAAWQTWRFHAATQLVLSIKDISTLQERGANSEILPVNDVARCSPHMPLYDCLCQRTA
jgi:hypothetical protein